MQPGKPRAHRERRDLPLLVATIIGGTKRSGNSREYPGVEAMVFMNRLTIEGLVFSALLHRSRVGRK